MRGSRPTERRMTSGLRTDGGPRAPARWLVVLVVGSAYAAGAAVSFGLFEASSVGAVLFPSAGVSLSALVLTSPRRWPWVLATVAVVETGVDLAYGLPAVSVAG